MLLLIGSAATNYWIGDSIFAHVNDIDVIGSLHDLGILVAEWYGHENTTFKSAPAYSGVVDGILWRGTSVSFVPTHGRKLPIDCELVSVNMLGNITRDLYNFIMAHSLYHVVECDGVELGVVYPEVLLQIHLSHRYKRNTNVIKWLSKFNILSQLPASGKLSLDAAADLATILSIRTKLTMLYKHPKLNQRKVDFFVDGTRLYVYDHDSIHEVVKLGAVPAYTKFLKLGAEVECDVNRWKALEYHEQINAVVEECMVLAIERCLIHHPQVHPIAAFAKAYNKVCTSITSGWFREFASKNKEAVFRSVPVDFWDRFQVAVQRNEVAMFEGK